MNPRVEISKEEIKRVDEDNHYDNDEMKIFINYLSNARDRLKKVLDKRENIK